MYKLLYSGNPPCCPVPQLPNLPPHGPPVLLDSCVALQIYFMLMQGNKLYVCFTSFSFFFGSSFYYDNERFQNVNGFYQETFACGSVGELRLCWVQLDLAGFEPGLPHIPLAEGAVALWAYSSHDRWQELQRASQKYMMPLDLLLANGTLLFLMPLVK